ncbi:MAG: hypothetical protein AAB767_02765 [Patescibacteria group bacterium]
MNYETRNCHCEHFAVALHRLREAIQKQGRATWIASGFALAMTIQDRVTILTVSVLWSGLFDGLFLHLCLS